MGNNNPMHVNVSAAIVSLRNSVILLKIHKHTIDFGHPRKLLSVKMACMGVESEFGGGAGFMSLYNDPCLLGLMQYFVSF